MRKSRQSGTRHSPNGKTRPRASKAKRRPYTRRPYSKDEIVWALLSGECGVHVGSWKAYEREWCQWRDRLCVQINALKGEPEASKRALAILFAWLGHGHSNIAEAVQGIVGNHPLPPPIWKRRDQEIKNLQKENNQLRLVAENVYSEAWCKKYLGHA